ncbi:MAG: hypothetical protein ACPL28_08165 [bacterium]
MAKIISVVLKFYLDYPFLTVNEKYIDFLIFFYKIFILEEIMIITLLFFSQTVISDFQVNGEDYPGSAPQLYPSVACYDSGGAIIWYDLRSPANGIRIFGTLINISGDTINKNFCLNDDTTSGCMNQPSIDNDTNGNFIITYIQHQNVMARRFNKSGIPYGPSFIVNTNSGCQYPSVAVSPSGRFVIIWLRTNENRIYGQIFDANGNPVGTNFVVSDSAIPYIGNIPGIGIKDNGDFIIAWQYNNEIWAQIFDSLGNRIGGNFRLINDTTSTSEIYPRLKFDNQNNLFVSWMASVQGQGDINCQIFDSTLTPITGIIKIDNTDIDSARYQSIAISDSVWFVVFQDDVVSGVYLQRIKTNGELIGNNIQINEQPGKRSYLPKIDVTKSCFIITWSRNLVGLICDIMCQKVSFDGALIGNNYVISDDKGGDPQILSNVAVDNNCDFFVVWTDYRRYPDFYYMPNCYGRRYDSQGNPYGDEFRINTYANADNATIGINSNVYVIVWARTQVDSNHQIYGQRFDLNGNPIGTNYQISLSSGTNELSFPRITTLSNNYFVVIWKEKISTIDKIYGRILDPMGMPTGIQFNPYFDSSGYNTGWSVVDEGNGKFIVPILCSTQDSIVIAIQEFDYNGNPVSEPITINESQPSYNCVCGTKGIDRYLFIWQQQSKIIGQFLDNNLQKIGINFVITDDTVSFKNYCSLVSSDDGKFFVIWDEERNDNPDLYGQFFDSMGNKIGNNFRVDNDTTNGEQGNPNAFSKYDRIYIAWDDSRIPAHWRDIYCKVIEWQNGQSIIEHEKENDQIFSEVYPDPFRNHLQIRYRIPDTRYQIGNVEQGFSLAEVVSSQYPVVSIKIYDISGRLVKSFNHLSANHPPRNLADGGIQPFNQVVWYGDDDLGGLLPSGVYFVRLEAGDYRRTEKAILLR